jgi:hypothetical protein
MFFGMTVVAKIFQILLIESYFRIAYIFLRKFNFMMNLIAQIFFAVFAKPAVAGNPRGYVRRPAFPPPF